MMLGNWSITVGNPWWLILIPLVLPPLALVELSQPGRAGADPPGAGDLVPDRGDHPDRAGPGRAADRSGGPTGWRRSSCSTSPTASRRAAEGRARLRRPKPRRSGARTTWPAWSSSARSRGSRCRRPPASSTCWASRARSTPRTPTWARRVKLALATLSRGHGPADRGALRRQREPRQPLRAGARPPSRWACRSTSCRSSTSTTAKCWSRRCRSRPTSRRARRSTSTW